MRRWVGLTTALCLAAGCGGEVQRDEGAPAGRSEGLELGPATPVDPEGEAPSPQLHASPRFEAGNGSDSGTSGESEEAGGAADEGAEEGRRGQVGALPPHAQAHGRDIGEWGAAWWAWALGADLEHNPVLDDNGEDCAVDQAGSVWFLAGAFGGSVERECRIPLGRSLFFPLVNYAGDYPCPAEFQFEPAAGQSLEDFLTDFVNDNIDGVDSLFVEVDGEALPDEFLYRGTSELYTFVGDTSLQSIDPCINGEEQVLVSDGYWVMLHPLTPGWHEIRFGGGISETDFSVSATYDIFVGN